MNKKISIPIIPVIIIIVVIIIAIILTQGAKEKISKLAEVYNQMVANQIYSFTRYDLEENNKNIICKKANKTLIDLYDSEGYTSTLILDGETYLISHRDKEYYVYPSSNSDEEMLTDNLKNIIDLEYTIGKEKIYGKTYKYEEYKGVTDFLISTANNIELDTAKTRFYFKGKELVYLKTIYNVVNEETGEKTEEEELQTVEVKYEVEDSIFEIPSDYAEN